MFDKFCKVAAIIVAAVFSQSVNAATLQQVGTANAGGYAQVDVDLAPFSGIIGGFTLELLMDPGLAFVGIQDNPTEGGNAPTYQLFADTGSGYVAVTSGSDQIIVSPLALPIGIIGSTSAFPNDNISKFRLAFAVASGAPDGIYQVGYDLTLSVQDNGVVYNAAFPESGNINLTVGSVTTQPVPLPAGGVLLIFGLGTLAVLRRTTAGA